MKRRGVAWMTYSYVVGFGLQGVYFLILARSLGPVEFGVFSGALALSLLMSTMSGMGAGHAMVIAVARDRSQFREHFGTFVAYVSTTFLPLCGIGLALAWLAGPEFLLVAAVLLVSEIIFTRAVDFSFQAFQAHDRLAVTANLNVGIALMRCGAVLLIFPLVEPSALGWAIVYAIINTAIGCGYLIVTATQFGWPKRDSGLLRGSWRTGVFFALGMSSRIAYTDGDKYLLNALGRADIAGEYSVASRLINLVFAPVQALVYAANTSMFRAGVDGFAAVWRLCKRMLLLGVGAAMAASLALALGAPLVPLVLGADFALAVDALRAVSLVPVLMAIHFVFGDALMGLGRQHIRATGQAIMAIIGVVLNVALIPIFGLAGVIFTLYIVHIGLIMVNVGAFWFGWRREALG